MASGRPCRVCQSAQRVAIEHELLSEGIPLPRISKHFEITIASLFRHRASHMTQQLQAAPATERGLDLWQQLRTINNVCLELLNNARLRGDDRVVLLAVDRVLRQLELSAKLLGDMTADTTVTVQVEQWPVLRHSIVRALEPFPEARARVLESLNGHAGG